MKAIQSDNLMLLINSVTPSPVSSSGPLPASAGQDGNGAPVANFTDLLQTVLSGLGKGLGNLQVDADGKTLSELMQQYFSGSSAGNGVGENKKSEAKEGADDMLQRMIALLQASVTQPVIISASPQAVSSATVDPGTTIGAISAATSNAVNTMTNSAGTPANAAVQALTDTDITSSVTSIAANANQSAINASTSANAAAQPNTANAINMINPNAAAGQNTVTNADIAVSLGQSAINAATAATAANTANTGNAVSLGQSAINAATAATAANTANTGNAVSLGQNAINAATAATAANTANTGNAVSLGQSAINAATAATAIDTANTGNAANSGRNAINPFTLDAGDTTEANGNAQAGISAPDSASALVQNSQNNTSLANVTQNAALDTPNAMGDLNVKELKAGEEKTSSDNSDNSTGGAPNAMLTAQQTTYSKGVEPAQETLPVSRLNELSNPILKTLGSGDTNLVIKLSPPDMGTIQIRLRMENGVLSADFKVDSATVKDLFTVAMPHIKQAIEGSGIKTGNFFADLNEDNNSYGSRQQNTNHQQQQKQQSDQKSNFFDFFA